MAERSKRITLYNKDKMKHINPETLKLFQKYQIDMSIRDLSKNTIEQYNADLKQCWQGCGKNRTLMHYCILLLVAM